MFKSAIVCSAVLGAVLLNATGIQQAAASPDLASPDANSPYTVSQRSIVDSMMNMFRGRQPRREGIRRSGELCPMSPGLVGTDQVWTNQPLFMWQGTVNQIVLKNFESGEELWNQPVDSTAQQIVYTGLALPPGLYQWELSNATTSSAFIFEVIGGDQRQQITNSLRELESQSSNKTSEEKALATADYFMQQGLWSDAFQVLYSINNPSTEVKQAAQEISAYVCPSRVVQ